MIGTPGTPLAKAQEARGYQQAFFLCRELAQMKAHLMTPEGWEILVRIQTYCGWRYNDILLSGTDFAPKPWRERQ